MKSDDLVARLKAIPGSSIDIHLVLDEDLYETRHGDGYYPHFRHALFSHQDAESFLTANKVKPLTCTRHVGAGPCFEQVVDRNHIGLGYHIVPARIELRDGKPHASWAHYFETASPLINDPRDIHQRIVEALPEK